MEENKFIIIRGRRIGLLREETGITQQDLADQVGVSRQTVVTWESRSEIKLKPDVVRKLIKALKVTQDDLTNDKHDKEKGDLLDHPIVKSYVSELDTLKKYVAYLEAEIDRLKSGGKK